MATDEPKDPGPGDQADATIVIPALDAVVIGVDGCRAGWVAAVYELGGGPNRSTRLRIEVTADFAAVVSLADGVGAQVVGVDIPIGFAVDGVRPAEIEARRLLGPRRSTLFPTPAHAVLAARDWTEALALNRSVTGKGLSRQAFNLVARSREVRAAITADDGRFVEAHPESSFTAMAGQPLEPKKTARGQRQRRSLIAHHLGPLDGTAARSRTGVGRDDVLDACAAVWTARRVVVGDAELLGSGQDPDGYSLQLAI